MIYVWYFTPNEKFHNKAKLEVFFIHPSTCIQSRSVSVKALLLPSPHCEWSLRSRIHLRPITLYLLHYTNTTFVSIFSCGLLKWYATPPEWYNSSSFGLSSLTGSLLSPVTYLGGFLKRSQRKLFHFCSLSNGAGWRDSWLEVGREEGYIVREVDTWEGG